MGVLYQKKEVEVEADSDRPRHYKSMKKKGGIVQENNWMDALTTDRVIYHKSSPSPERTLEVTETLKVAEVNEDDDVTGMLHTTKEVSMLRKHDMFVAAGAMFAADVGIQKVHEEEVVADVAHQEEEQPKHAKKEKKNKEVVETVEEEVAVVVVQEEEQPKHAKKEKKNKEVVEMVEEEVTVVTVQEEEQPKHNKKEKKHKEVVETVEHEGEQPKHAKKEKKHHKEHHKEK